MKNFCFLLILVLASSACDNTNGPSIERLYYENAELSLPSDNPGTHIIWETGQKTAIVFSFQHPDKEEIADDELTELFYIELPADATEFSINTSDDLLHPEIELYYARSCYCYFEAPYTFIRKNISGQKISGNQWRISFDIIAATEDYEYELADTGIYTLSTLEN